MKGRTKKITLIIYHLFFFFLKFLDFISKKKFSYVFKDIITEKSYEYIYINKKKINFFIPTLSTKYRLANFFNKEPETLIWINKFKKKCIFFDIGANNGNYSIYASSIHPNIKEIYAFEPSFLNTKILARNIFINNLQKKINIIQLPLFNKKLKILNMSESSFIEGGSFNSFGVDYNSNGKIKNSLNNYRILGASIDFLQQLKILPIPDYIKIDVDGIEHLILMGAKKTLKNSKIKSILIELYPGQKTQYNQSLKILRESGFKLSKKYFYNHIFIR